MLSPSLSFSSQRVTVQVTLCLDESDKKKNENIKFPNGHSITINKKGYWEKEEFVGNKGEVIKIKAEPSEQGMLLKISDGTTIAATKDGLKVIRNNEVLSYGTRKKFVESFGKKLTVAEMMQKKKGQEK